MQEFPTQRVLELSFAAYRVNGGYEKQTRRYSEDIPTKFSNKELITYSLYIQENKDVFFVPNDFKNLEVIEDDLSSKALAEKHMQRYTMLALGNLSNFESDIFTAYSSENITPNRIGFLAYLPEFINREMKDREYKNRLKIEFAESNHINLHKISEETVEILKMIPLREYETYLYIGAIGKNLVSFNKKDILEIGKKYNIRAKTKCYDKERDLKLPLTRLNYVKLKKVDNNDY